MSVLIKNMEMPNKCWDCELFDELSIHFTGITAPNTDIGWCRGCKKEILDMDYKECKPIWCPLVEISTPHGRIIDAEKFAKDIYSAWTLWEKKGENCYLFSDVLVPMLVGQPTVIESEE